MMGRSLKHSARRALWVHGFRFLRILMGLSVMARRMGEAGQRAFRFVRSLGFDPRKLVLALRGARRFVGTARRYRRLWHGGRFLLRWSEPWPILEDFGA